MVNVTQDRPYVSQTAEKYGVPEKILSGAVWAEDLYNPIDIEQAARELTGAYSKRGEWGAAVDQYSADKFGGDAAYMADVIKQTGGVTQGPVTASESPSLWERFKSVTTIGDWGTLGKIAGVGVAPVQQGVVRGEVPPMMKSIVVVGLGAAFIIIAVLSFKPARDAVATVATRGKK